MYNNFERKSRLKFSDSSSLESQNLESRLKKRKIVHHDDTEKCIIINNFENIRTEKR